MPNHEPFYVRLRVNQPFSLDNAQGKLRSVQELFQCLDFPCVGQQNNMSKFLAADIGIRIESVQQSSFFGPLASNHDCPALAFYRIE